MGDEDDESFAGRLEFASRHFGPIAMSVGRDGVNRSYAGTICNRPDVMTCNPTFPVERRGLHRPQKIDDIRRIPPRQAVAGHEKWCDKYLPGTIAPDPLAPTLGAVEVTRRLPADRIDER
jgi:hypothetical protein